MPEISRFLGIIIRMYISDHNPPHFHAIFGEHEAVIEISTTNLIAGSLPLKQLRLVQAWAVLHQTELFYNFECLKIGKNEWKKIDPLML